jgi:alkaline phosphatase
MPKRTLLLIATLSVSLLLAGIPGLYAEDKEMSIARFGTITDIHHCDKASAIPDNRYYPGALSKVNNFTKQMNDAKASFVIEMGDFTDKPADNSLTPEQKKAACLKFAGEIETAFGQFSGNRYHVLGNHDTDCCSKEEFAAKITNTGITPQKGTYYYSFNSGKMHFVVLDAAYKENGTPVDGNTGYSWTDAFIPDGELAWLKADLAAANAPTIVFLHYLLEVPASNTDPAHCVKNAAEVRAILEADKQVLAVFEGHYHGGGYMQENGIHYINLLANVGFGVDPTADNQYSLIDVFEINKGLYRLVVTGAGFQPSFNVTAKSI